MRRRAPPKRAQQALVILSESEG